MAVTLSGDDGGVDPGEEDAVDVAGDDDGDDGGGDGGDDDGDDVYYEPAEQERCSTKILPNTTKRSFCTARDIAARTIGTLSIIIFRKNYGTILMEPSCLF